MEDKDTLSKKVELLELKVKLYELKDEVQKLDEKVAFLENKVNELQEIVAKYQKGSPKSLISKENVNSVDSEEHKTKDTTKYLFEGVEYSKSRLVLAVVTKYATDNKQITGQELIDTFPADKIPLGSWSCLKFLKDIPVKYQSAPPRYFCKNHEIIKLSNGDVLATCTQWTVDSIRTFVDYVRNNLGYEITEIIR